MAPSKTTDDAANSITLTKAQVAVICEGLCQGAHDFKPVWTEVGRALQHATPRNAGRAFKDAIAKIGLELKDGGFSKIATDEEAANDEGADDEAAEDQAVEASKGVKGKKRKSTTPGAAKEGVSNKKSKMEKDNDNEDGDGEASTTV